MTMRKIYFLFLIIGISSCTSVKQIGKVNMISNRNIDPNLKYKLVSSYSGGSDSELKNSEAKNIEEAIDQTVRKIPGAEFLMNVKIYIIDERYYAVEGDAWGSSTDITYRGFKVGDKVSWKKWGDFNTGTITSLKDNKNCLIIADNDNKAIELSYDEIIKYDGQKTSAQLNEEKKSKEAKAKQEEKEKQQQNLEREKQEKLKIASNFKIGDYVTWKKFGGKYLQGKIVGVGLENAIVSYTDTDGSEQKKEVTFEKLTKINPPNNETTKNLNVTEQQTNINDKTNVTNEKVTTDKKDIVNENVTNSTKETFKVTSEFLNIRSGAGTTYDIVVKINKGTSVDLIEKMSTEWWKIKYNDKIGFVSPKYLSK